MKQSMSESEREVMRVLWAESPLNAAEIVKRVQQAHPWNENTIKTFLTRLREKGIVKAEKRGVFFYTPTMTEEQAGLNEAREVIERHFGGSVGALMAGFCKSGTLSDAEFAELEELIRKHREKRK